MRASLWVCILILKFTDLLENETEIGRTLFCKHSNRNIRSYQFWSAFFENYNRTSVVNTIHISSFFADLSGRKIKIIYQSTTVSQTRLIAMRSILIFLEVVLTVAAVVVVFHCGHCMSSEDDLRNEDDLKN